MLTRTVRIQLLAFVVIAVLGITYVAVRYVGVARWLGASGYTVKVDLSDAGGIFTNAEVDYRGTPVGRVGDMRVTAKGIQVDLDITSDRHISSSAKAVVANRSVLGEQYVDLQPETTDRPYLHDGSVITVQHTVLPPPVQDLLYSGDQLAASVPVGALRTVVGELYDATQGLGSSLSTLLSSSDSFFGRATTDLPQTIDLTNSAATVLATQNHQASQIKQFAENLRLIGAQLKASDGDISKVLSRTTGAADEFGGFVGQIQGSLKGLLSNLLTTSVVFLARKDGLREVLVQLPVAVSIGNKTITPQGINVGLVPTFFDPTPCVAGYGGTTMRKGSDTSGNPALNTNAGCTQPASRGNVRGTQNAPAAGK